MMMVLMGPPPPPHNVHNAPDCGSECTLGAGRDALQSWQGGGEGENEQKEGEGPSGRGWEWSLHIVLDEAKCHAHLDSKEVCQGSC